MTPDRQRLPPRVGRLPEGLESPGKTRPVTLRLYLGNADPHNPLASPVYSDRRGLPAVPIHIGDAEVSLDDTWRDADGIDGVEVHVWDGILHVFPSSTGILDSANAALASIGMFIASHMTSNH